MAHRKNKIDLLDNITHKSHMEESLEYDDDDRYGDYSYYESCNCSLCSIVEYDYYDGYKETKSGRVEGRMIDLDSISIERKRNSRIDKVLNNEKTVLEELLNEKLS